jgi:hypothetical protein
MGVCEAGQSRARQGRGGEVRKAWEGQGRAGKGKAGIGTGRGRQDSAGKGRAG